MSFKYCNHIKENGTYCRAAALGGRNFCYFHARLRARRLAIAQARSEGKVWELQLPPLEDMHAVQSSIMEVLEALAAGLIDQRRARLMLQGLQMASTNLRSNAWLLPSRFELNPDADFRAQTDTGLEKEFALPKRIDIDTPPEVAFPTPPPEEEPAPMSARKRKPQSTAATATAAAATASAAKKKVNSTRAARLIATTSAAKTKDTDRAPAGDVTRPQETDRANHRVQPAEPRAAKRPPYRVTLEDLLYSHTMQAGKE